VIVEYIRYEIEAARRQALEEDYRPPDPSKIAPLSGLRHRQLR
jgi:hypothetical protein